MSNPRTMTLLQAISVIVKYVAALLPPPSPEGFGDPNPNPGGTDPGGEPNPTQPANPCAGCTGYAILGCHDDTVIRVPCGPTATFKTDSASVPSFVAN